jgi:hypothetical protein
MDIPALPTHFDPNKGGMVEFGDDSKLFVTFRAVSVVNPVRSQEAGRPIHEMVDYVRIQQPGERDCTDRPATQMDVQRFRRQWQMYQDGRSQIPDGTLLSVLFPNNPEIVDNLKYFKISTVEQLAELNDTQIQNVGIGGRAFHDAAKKYLAAADKGKDYHALAKSVDALKRDREADQQKIAALEAALDEAEGEDATPRKRGRPRKDAQQAA